MLTELLEKQMLDHWCEIARKIGNYANAILDQCLICRPVPNTCSEQKESKAQKIAREERMEKEVKEKEESQISSYAHALK